jgi:uncharacterized membrane protein
MRIEFSATSNPCKRQINVSFFMGKSERKTRPFIPRRRRKYDITVDLNFGLNVDCIFLAYGIVEWWPFFLTWICLTAGGYVRSDASDPTLAHSHSHK